MSNQIDEPDGYALRYSRATDVLHFGPFATWDEAVAWATEHRLACSIVPLHLTLDWNRGG